MLKPTTVSPARIPAFVRYAAQNSISSPGQFEHVRIAPVLEPELLALDLLHRFLVDVKLDVVVEAERVVLLGFLVERDDAAVGMKSESQLFLGGDARDEGAGAPRLVDVERRVERHVLEYEPAFRLPLIYLVDIWIVYQERRGVLERDPADMTRRILSLYRRQDARGDENVSHGVEIDDQNLRADRVEIDAVRAASLPREAGLVAGETPAVDRPRFARGF